MSKFSTIRHIGGFSTYDYSRAVMDKKCTKTNGARAGFLFWSFNLFFFLTFSFPSKSRFLELPGIIPFSLVCSTSFYRVIGRSPMMESHHK